MAGTFSCKNCVACCGIVPVSLPEMVEIQKFLKKMKPKEIKRLKKQKRDPFQCMFVDTEKQRCSIYEVRPNICRQYGYVKGLACPFHPEYATNEYQGEKHMPIGVLGSTITWKNIMDYSNVLVNN